MSDRSDPEYVEIERGPVTWRFERDFLESNWTCIFGRGCQGILERSAEDLNQGCCSVGAHFGPDDETGQAEARQVSAYAALLDADVWQFHAEAQDLDRGGIFGDHTRTHTRIIDDACIFLNRPGFAGGEGCALHIGAERAGESPVDWKPSVCWQLPLYVDWQEIDEVRETATVRRWTRADWTVLGETMAWCCTERTEGGEAYVGDRPVVDSLREELSGIAGEEVWVELRTRLDQDERSS